MSLSQFTQEFLGFFTYAKLPPANQYQANTRVVVTGGDPSGANNAERYTDGTTWQLFNGSANTSLAWIAGISYSIGQQVLAPEGRLIVCRVAHVSGSIYDATNWVYPGPDNSTLVDFTVLPNGNSSTAVPTYGSIINFGVPPARYAEYGMASGRFVGLAPTAVTYFEIGCPDPREKLQHVWVEADIAATPAAGNGLTLVCPSDDWRAVGSAFQAGIHWALNPSMTAGDYSGLMQTGGYNAPGVISGPTHIPTLSWAGRRVRWDITVDRVSGVLRSYINGQIVIQYTDTTAINFISHRAICEIGSTYFNIHQFGCSSHLPNFVSDGSKRTAAFGDNDYFANTALTASWQLIYSFRVAYDEGGAVIVDWNPYVNCSSGQVLMELSSSLAAPANTYPQILSGSPTNCRLPFSSRRYGVPNTTELIGIWAKTTGAASMQNSNYGDSVGGPQWRPANYRARYA